MLQLLTSSLSAYVSGMVVVKLANSTDIHAGVLLHPGQITEEQINGKHFSNSCQIFVTVSMFSQMLSFIVSDVKIPIAILGAEIDQYSPPEQLRQFGKKLSEKSEVSPTKKSFLYSLIMILNFINVNVLFQFKIFV